MLAAGVAKNVREIWLHRFKNSFVDMRCRRMVKVYPLHRSASFLLEMIVYVKILKIFIKPFQNFRDYHNSVTDFVYVSKLSASVIAFQALIDYKVKNTEYVFTLLNGDNIIAR
jgi:hypothetical protein